MGVVILLSDRLGLRPFFLMSAVALAVGEQNDNRCGLWRKCVPAGRL